MGTHTIRLFMLLRDARLIITISHAIQIISSLWQKSRSIISSLSLLRQLSICFGFLVDEIQFLHVHAHNLIFVLFSISSTHSFNRNHFSQFKSYCRLTLARPAVPHKKRNSQTKLKLHQIQSIFFRCLLQFNFDKSSLSIC